MALEAPSASAATVTGDQAGRGPARRIADRRRHRRLLPGFGEARRRGGVGRSGPRSASRDRRRHAAAGQPVAQLLACPGQPRLDRPDRAAQSLRRLLVGQALQVAEQHRQPEPIGEPAQFLVELRPGFRRRLDRRDSTRRIAMATSAPRRSRSRRRAASRRARRRDPRRDPVEPARDRIRPPDRIAPAAPAPGTSPARRPRRRDDPRGSAGRPGSPSARAAPPAPRTPPRPPRPARAGTDPASSRRCSPVAVPVRNRAATCFSTWTKIRLPRPASTSHRARVSRDS